MMAADLLAARLRTLRAGGGFDGAREGGVASPCVALCRMSEDGAQCLGCFRTGAEIARWQAVDDGQRRAIWRALLGRAGLAWPHELA